MQAIHSLGILSTSRYVDENLGFMLSNKKGSYCSFFNVPTSRYQGLFYFDKNEMKMYKFIENIELVNHDNVAYLKNGLYFAERGKRNIVETFLMPRHFNSLIYWLNAENEIDLVLDCKDSYDNREFGRHYEIDEEEGCIVVKFTKKTNAREDSSDGAEEFSLYLSIKSDTEIYKKNDKWIERNYIDDEERMSHPFKRYVYNALRLKGAKFVFSISRSKSAAIRECLHVFNSIDEIKNMEKWHFLSSLSSEPIKKIIKNQRISNEIKIAYINSFNSIDNLIAENKSSQIIFAGLPWFFQLWARDSLVSLKSISKIHREFAQKLLFNFFGSIASDGRLQNLIGQNAPKKLNDLRSADAHGWLFLRCTELINKICKDKDMINSIKKSVMQVKQNKKNSTLKTKEQLKKYNLLLRKKEDECHKLSYEIESSLEKSIAGLLKFHTRDCFEFNEAKETWMDTEFGNDKRTGARIEVQALRLNMYSLMFEMSRHQKYKILENVLKIKVREKFWNGEILADGLEDFTIRPNIFIAAYAYPELLAREEWEMCFENALKSLWLGWGGLSTIDKKSWLYTDASTGEDSKSYHRGDSWFWINNLTALVLHRTNEDKFSKQIKKIIDASTEEILWKGCIGCHSEISDAKQLSGKGCYNQAWSNAMFIELIDEVFK